MAQSSNQQQREFFFDFTQVIRDQKATYYPGFKVTFICKTHAKAFTRFEETLKAQNLNPQDLGELTLRITGPL